MSDTISQPTCNFPPLSTCSDIAKVIATAHQTTCSKVSVWRAVQRLRLEPIQKTESGYKFYSDEQARLVEASLTRITGRITPAKATEPAAN